MVRRAVSASSAGGFCTTRAAMNTGRATMHCAACQRVTVPSAWRSTLSVGAVRRIAADSAAGFFLAGRGNVEGRLATDMANFNANMVSPSATAEEQAKKSTSLTDVLKSLDQKIKDASSVLVMKEGGK